jgi:hypothetical protein
VLQAAADVLCFSHVLIDVHNVFNEDDKAAEHIKGAISKWLKQPASAEGAYKLLVHTDHWYPTWVKGVMNGLWGNLPSDTKQLASRSQFKKHEYLEGMLHCHPGPGTSRQLNRPPALNVRPSYIQH